MHSIFTSALLLFCLLAPGTLWAEETATKKALIEIGKDGSISVPGVHISEDGSVDALGVHIEGATKNNTPNDTASQEGKGTTPSDLTINSDDRTMGSQQFKGQNLTINGDHCTLSGSGNLNRVTINGDAATLEIAGTVHSLILNGDENRVSYQQQNDAPASQTDNGENNTVTLLER